jgi:hypothetical protein
VSAPGNERFMTAADGTVAAALVLLTVASFWWAGAMAEGGTDVVAEVEGAVVWKGALDTPASAALPVRLGTVTVEIRDGRVAVTESDCPNHVCVRTGWRSRAGDVIVCVPNRTVVRIARGRSKEPEGVTG